MSKAGAMHAWVFRNRARLRLIYGAAPPPALPAPEPELDLDLDLDLGSDPDLLRPEIEVSTTPSDAGLVLRRARYVVLRPMPRQAW
jgi:hypothetical protein